MGIILDKIMGRMPKANHRVALGLIDVDPVLITENGKRLMREAMEANPELWSEDTDSITGFPVGGHKFAEKQTFAAGEIPLPSVDIDVTESFKAAATENTTDTAREVINADDKYSVDYHLKNINSILSTIETRRASLLETMRVDREEFEARDADNAAKVAELNRLESVYHGALKVAAPGGADGYGYRPAGEPIEQTGDRIPAIRVGFSPLPVDPDRLTEVGKKIAATTRAARRRKPSTPATKET